MNVAPMLLNSEHSNRSQKTIPRSSYCYLFNSILFQCLNIFKTAVVQRKRVKTHMLIGQEG